MKRAKLEDMVKGWFIGHFEPSLLKTDQFEVGLLTRKKGPDPEHYHAIATEYNLLVSGSMTLNGEELSPGDLFVIEPNEVATPIFHEDSVILCVKTPSIPNDKYIV
jgi:quercetin dioxygenase-like cupin family protein